jgi:hypothetical protein
MGDLEAVSGLLRLRVVLVTAMMAVLAVVAGNIFDRQVWWLLMAVALPALVSIVVSNFASVVRFISALLSIGTSVTIIVFAVGGQASDVVDALTAGTQRLLSTDWPSPERPDLIGTVGLVLAVPTAVAADLAGRRDWHLLALTPIVASGVLVTALCAPSGAQMVWLIPVGLLAAIFATLRPMIGDDREIGAQRVWLRGERRLIPVVLLAGLVAAAVSVPTVLADRADPRRNEPAKQTAPLLDPIEATLALRALDPPADLYQLTTESGINLPDRWRTAALNDYDGQRWTPALTLRPIGRRLTPDTSGMFMFDLELLDDGLALVPFPSTPITINVPVETDSDRTVVRLTERIDPGDTIAVSSGPIITTADALATGIATRVIDDSVSSLTEFAETLAGDGTVLDQLRQIQSTMRDDWVLASNAPGAGLQRALLERFIRDTKRGTAEQFAAAYVLLARSLGVDARVATGFVGARSATGSALTLVSSDAAVWPEVGLLDGRWIAFDPVPPDEASDVAPPDEPAVQTPAAAQPPIAPAPELTPDTADDEVGNDASSTTAGRAGRPRCDHSAREVPKTPQAARFRDTSTAHHGGLGCCHRPIGRRRSDDRAVSSKRRHRHLRSVAGCECPTRVDSARNAVERRHLRQPSRNRLPRHRRGRPLGPGRNVNGRSTYQRRTTSLATEPPFAETGHPVPCPLTADAATAQGPTLAASWSMLGPPRRSSSWSWSWSSQEQSSSWATLSGR